MSGAVTTSPSGRPLVPKPPPLPLAALTQLLNLPNVSFVPLGTLLATTRSEGDALFTRQIGGKASTAAARAAEQARKKKKEEEAQQLALASSRNGSRKGSAASRRGSATRRGVNDNESDVFSIPEYVKNPYAPLFIGRKAGPDDAALRRRKSRRKSDLRRRSSAAWVMPTEAELAEDAMPRPLQPSMYSRDAKLASLEHEKEQVASKIVDGRECALKSVTTYGSPKSMRGESVKYTLLDPSVCVSPKTTPRHILHALEKLQTVAKVGGTSDADGPRQVAEVIDWTADDHSAGAKQTPRGPSGSSPPGGQHQQTLPALAGSSPRSIKSHPAPSQNKQQANIVRSLVPLEVPSQPAAGGSGMIACHPAASSTVYHVDDVDGDIRSFLPRAPRVPPVLARLLERSGHPSTATGALAAPSAVRQTTVELLQHRDGTISVKPNPPKYVHLTGYV